MKKFLRIKHSEWLGTGNTKIIYTDENEERYLGPLIQWVAGSTVIVEVSEGRMPDGLFHIIKVVDVIPPQH